MPDSDSSGAPRVLAICHDAPYPPHHGGRIDMWNRLIGFRTLGMPVQILYWSKGHPDPASQAAMREHGFDVIPARRRRHWSDALRLKYPLRLLSYDLHGTELLKVEQRVQRFAPDWIVLEGWEGFLVARRFADGMGRLLVYRSQNIEHRYWRQQLRYAAGRDKLPFLLTVPWLASVEREIRGRADAILDISQEDHDWWRAVDPLLADRVLGPTYITGGSNGAEWHDRNQDIDVLFVGNLYAPNNVEAMRWFCDQVLPRLRASGMPVRTVVAGSHPSKRLLEFCAGSGVEVIANPDAVEPLYQRARVLINPLQRASGVNIKMLSMLETQRPIVSTPQGLHGLAEGLRRFCLMATDASDFASMIRAGWQMSVSQSDGRSRRAALEACCGVETLRQLVAELHRSVRTT